ncbi:MAG TPA: hypothetical protein VJM32_05960 [Candidatus Saccharimonadales bacterium]|nr:hypothetical protein [Candidatus Saccharimonadales bacterium]
MHIGSSFTDPTAKIRISVLIGGVPQPLYRRLDGKVFVAGAPGQVYALRAENLTDRQIEVVAAVDQRNVLKDEPINLKTAGGMLIRGRSSYTWQGWRLDDANVGQFVFGTPEVSVAAQATSSVSGTGIIGFAVYTEEAYDSYSPYATRSGGVPKGVARGGLEDVMRGPATMGGHASRGGFDVEERSLGTGIGATVSDGVRHVHFNRAPGDPTIVGLGYHTYEVLDAMGLIRAGEPEPFPAPSTATGYGAYNRA